MGPDHASKPEADAKAELEFHIDARHISDDVRVGVAHAVFHLYTVDTSLVHVATGSATALGAPVMANTPNTPAAIKSRPVRDRVTHVVNRTVRFF